MGFALASFFLVVALVAPVAGPTLFSHMTSSCIPHQLTINPLTDVDQFRLYSVELPHDIL